MEVDGASTWWFAGVEPVLCWRTVGRALESPLLALLPDSSISEIKLVA